MRALDLTGKRFGLLTVEKRIGSHNRRALWLCRCDCGNICERTTQTVKQNTHSSCGCVTKELQRNAFRSHGMSDTRLYRIWKAMRERCRNASVACYKYYGGKGIRVCKEWSNDFQAFHEWAVSHDYADNLTIDRINPSQDYKPDNCRWITQADQNRVKKAAKECSTQAASL